MTTMLKMLVPVAVCLAYLWLQVDAAAVGPNGQGGDGGSSVAGTDQCPELQYECTRPDCNELCANLNYRKGICISKIIECKNFDVLHKRCTCVGQSSNSGSEEPSEYAGAGEGSSTNVSNSDTNNSNSSASGTSGAKPSRGKPGASSKAPALNKPTAAPGAATADTAKPTNAPAAYTDIDSTTANVPDTTVKTP